MTEEARLTDFVGADDGDERRDDSPEGGVDDSPAGDTAGPDPEGGGAEAAADPPPTAADAAAPADPDRPSPQPAVATYAWDREGTCGACGTTVERRWRDGDRFVCAACKSW